MRWFLLTQMGLTLVRPSPASPTDLFERTALSSEENETSTYDTESSIMRRSGALSRRAFLHECDSDTGKEELVEEVLDWCEVIAGHGKRAAEDPSNTNVKNWFRSDEQDIRTYVAAIFQAIVNECGGHNDPEKTNIVCQDKVDPTGRMGCVLDEYTKSILDPETLKDPSRIHGKYLTSAHASR